MRSDDGVKKLKNSNLIYNNAAIEQMVFFRDRIATLFLTAPINWQDNLAFQRYERFVHIVGWHNSKSCKLPVYGFETDRIRVRARDNFYNWNVSVDCDINLRLPDYLKVDAMSDYLFLEGMSEYRYSSYQGNNALFSFAMSDKYDLYAVMKCIASQLS